MKISYLILVFFGTMGVCYSQQAAVSSSGNVKNSFGSMSFAVGIIEPKPVSNEHGSMTAGIQIPLEVLTTVTSPSAKDQNIKIYPNPVESVLKIDYGNNQVIKANLFDVDFKFIESFNISEISNEMDLNKLNSGIYIIEIIDNNNQIINSTRLIKKNK